MVRSRVVLKRPLTMFLCEDLGVVEERMKDLKVECLLLEGKNVFLKEWKRPTEGDREVFVAALEEALSLFFANTQSEAMELLSHEVLVELEDCLLEDLKLGYEVVESTDEIDSSRLLLFVALLWLVAVVVVAAVLVGLLLEAMTPDWSPVFLLASSVTQSLLLLLLFVFMFSSLE